MGVGEGFFPYKERKVSRMVQTVWQDSGGGCPRQSQNNAHSRAHRQPGAVWGLSPQEPEIRLWHFHHPDSGHKASENGHQEENLHNDAEGWILCFKSWLNMVIFFLTAWIFGGRLGQEDLLK